VAFAGVASDDGVGIQLAAVDPYRAPEAAADFERRLDDGVAGEARWDRLEIRDFAGWVAAGHSVILLVVSGTIIVNRYIGGNDPTCIDMPFGLAVIISSSHVHDWAVPFRP
jgi:hypothetical protein